MNFVYAVFVFLVFFLGDRCFIPSPNLHSFPRVVLCSQRVVVQQARVRHCHCLAGLLLHSVTTVTTKSGSCISEVRRLQEVWPHALPSCRLLLGDSCIVLAKVGKKSLLMLNNEPLFSSGLLGRTYADAIVYPLQASSKVGPVLNCASLPLLRSHSSKRWNTQPCPWTPSPTSDPQFGAQYRTAASALIWMMVYITALPRSRLGSASVGLMNS